MGELARPIIAMELCSRTAERPNQPRRPLFSTLSASHPTMDFQSSLLMILLTSRSENEFFTSHLVDSVHRVQLCEKKKKSHFPSLFAYDSQSQNSALLRCHLPLLALHCLSHGALGDGVFYLQKLATNGKTVL